MCNAAGRVAGLLFIGVCLHLLSVPIFARDGKAAGGRGSRKQSSYQLTQKTNGIDGKLLIVESGGKGQMALQVVTNKGETVISQKLDYGSISPDRIIDIPGWFAYSVDRSAGFGSYNGVETEFFRIRDGQIEWLTAEDRKAGRSEKVRLLTSLKTAWKIIDLRGPQILAVACRPAFRETGRDDADFITIYERYYRKDKKWLKLSREEKGFREFEDESDFPPESLFPR